MSLEIFSCYLNLEKEIKVGLVHAKWPRQASALLRWALNCLPTRVLSYLSYVWGAYEGSGQVRVGPTNYVQRKKFKRLVTCTYMISPAHNSPIFCLCLDQKLLLCGQQPWARCIFLSYWTIHSNWTKNTSFIFVKTATPLPRGNTVAPCQSSSVEDTLQFLWSGFY